MAQPKHQDPPPAPKLSVANRLSIMKMVHDHYRMDIEQIWKRGAIYLTVSSALLVLILSDDFDIGEAETKFVFVGLILSTIWLINSSLTCYWIWVWRVKLKEIDEDVNPYKSFSKGETKKYKVFSFLSRPQLYAACLPAIFVVVWLDLWLASLAK